MNGDGDNDDKNLKMKDGLTYMTKRVLMVAMMMKVTMMVTMVMVTVMKKPEEDGWPDPLDKECVARLTGQRQNLRRFWGSHIRPNL